MRWSLAKFSDSEASNHTASLADFTTTTPELKFSVHTTLCLRPSEYKSWIESQENRAVMNAKHDA